METQLIIERGVPLPLTLMQRMPNACVWCRQRDRVSPYKTCDECRRQVKLGIQERMVRGICTQSPCPNRVKTGHVMCADHLQSLLAYSKKRRASRLKAKLCIDCGLLPPFWSQRCLACRQKDTNDPLPPGARKALARYRRREAISNRREQAEIAVEWTNSSRTAKIISMRHGLEDGIDRTLEEIGAEFSITRERVRQIEDKHLAWLASEGFDVSLLRPPFKEVSRKPFATRRQLVNNEKRWQTHAHGLVARALETGELIKGTCEFLTPEGKCGDLNTIGHHRDYDKPLEVEWLCRKHHMDAHRGFWLDNIKSNSPLLAKLRQIRPRQEEVLQATKISSSTLKKILRGDSSVRDKHVNALTKYVEGLG